MENKFRVVKMSILFATINIYVRRIFYLFRISILFPLRRLAAKFSVSQLYRRLAFQISVQKLCAAMPFKDGFMDTESSDLFSAQLRYLVRKCAGLRTEPHIVDGKEDCRKEISVLIENSNILRPVFEKLRSRRVLYYGQCYYNSFYLSRSLRSSGWKADLLDWDQNKESKKFYHGSDFDFIEDDKSSIEYQVSFFLSIPRFIC